jgi:hypothetical protein
VQPDERPLVRVKPEAAHHVRADADPVPLARVPVRVPAADQVHADVGVRPQCLIKAPVAQSGAGGVQGQGSTGQVLVEGDRYPLAGRNAHGFHDRPLPYAARDSGVIGTSWLWLRPRMDPVRPLVIIRLAGFGELRSVETGTAVRYAWVRRHPVGYGRP